MKKILHLSKYNIPRYGGIERVVDTITSGLCRTYNHTIISFKKLVHEQSNKKLNIDNICESSLLTILSQPINIHYFINVKKYMYSFSNQLNAPGKPSIAALAFKKRRSLLTLPAIAFCS